MDDSAKTAAPPSNQMAPWVLWMMIPISGVCWGFFLTRTLCGATQFLLQLALAMGMLLAGLLLGSLRLRGGRECYLLPLWMINLFLMLIQFYEFGLSFLIFGWWVSQREAKPWSKQLFRTSLFLGGAGAYFMSGNVILALSIILTLELLLAPGLSGWRKFFILLVFPLFFVLAAYIELPAYRVRAQKDMSPLTLLCAIGSSESGTFVPSVLVVNKDGDFRAAELLKDSGIDDAVNLNVEKLQTLGLASELCHVIVLESYIPGDKEFVGNLLKLMHPGSLLVAPVEFARENPRFVWSTLPAGDGGEFVITRRSGKVTVDGEKIESRLRDLAGEEFCPLGTFYGLLIDFKSTEVAVAAPEPAAPAASRRWWIVLLPLALAVMEVFSRRKRCDAAIVGCWENGFILAVLCAASLLSREGNMGIGNRIALLIFFTLPLAVSLSLQKIPTLVMKISAVVLTLAAATLLPGVFSAALVFAGMVAAVENGRVPAANLFQKLPALLSSMFCGLLLVWILSQLQAAEHTWLLLSAAAMQAWTLRR